MMEAEYWKIRKTYKYIDAIICPSSFVKSKLDSNPLFKEKTVTIHNFIDIPEYEKKESEKKYVLYFGRLSEEKGIKTLIEVCKALPEINFVFVGTGPLTDEVKRVDNIDYKGFQQDDNLWNLIANASFCVCPSEWNEVFGLTIGEAMVIGTPVVASNIGGIPEIIGESGKLFTPGDIQELACVIKELWSDESKLTDYSMVSKAADRITIGKYYAHLYRVGGVLLVLPLSEKYILYFGRYSEEKGIFTLIEACSKLKKMNFIFAGTGLLEDEINGVSNIQNVGFLKGRLLKRVIQNAWFSVYPSEWYENCPFSVMESQMNGTPVIGAKIGGIPELIRQGETGELFKAGDVDDLVIKMSELWKNETIILNYKHNCKHLNFDSIDIYCQKILKIYC